MVVDVDEDVNVDVDVNVGVGVGVGVGCSGKISQRRRLRGEVGQARQFAELFPLL